MMFTWQHFFPIRRVMRVRDLSDMRTLRAVPILCYMFNKRRHTLVFMERGSPRFPYNCMHSNHSNGWWFNRAGLTSYDTLPPASVQVALSHIYTSPRVQTVSHLRPTAQTGLVAGDTSPLNVLTLIWVVLVWCTVRQSNQRTNRSGSINTSSTAKRSTPRLC